MNKSPTNMRRTSKKKTNNIKKVQSNKNKNIDKNINKNIKKNVNKDINKISVKKNDNHRIVEDNHVKLKKRIDSKKRINNENNGDIRKFPNKNLVDKKTKESPSKNKKINKRKRVFLVFTFTFIGIVICFVYLIFNLSVFDLKNVIVTGNLKYTSSEIISNSNFKTNKNIFLQYLKYKDIPLINLPYIENVEVDLVFPNQINLNVLERESRYIAYDKDKNEFFKLDIEGYILEETNQDKRQNGEVFVYGITFNDQVVLGEKINEIDLDKLKIFEKIAEEYNNSNIGDNITKVNFENSLTTITLNDKLNVILPNDTNLKYNLDLLKSILKKNGDLQGIIDMTKDNPVFSTF